MKVYVQNIKTPDLRFEVLEFDKATGIGKLRGKHGTEWTRDISKPTLEKCGYKLTRVEDEEAA